MVSAPASPSSLRRSALIPSSWEMPSARLWPLVGSKTSPDTPCSMRSLAPAPDEQMTGAAAAMDSTQVKLKTSQVDGTTTNPAVC